MSPVFWIVCYQLINIQIDSKFNKNTSFGIIVASANHQVQNGDRIILEVAQIIRFIWVKQGVEGHNNKQ